MGEAAWFGCRDYLAVPHEKLYHDLNSGPGVGVADPVRELLDEARARLEEAQSELLLGLARLREGWEGEAAERADVALRELRNWTDEAVAFVREVRRGLDAQVEHYVRAVRTMPPPVPVTATDTAFTRGLAEFFGLTTDLQEQEVAAREAHMKAAAVMDVYAASTFDTLVRIPRFEPAPRVVVEVVEEGSARPPVVVSGGEADVTVTAHDGRADGTDSADGTDGTDGGKSTVDTMGSGSDPSPEDPARDAAVDDRTASRRADGREGQGPVAINPQRTVAARPATGSSPHPAVLGGSPVPSVAPTPGDVVPPLTRTQGTTAGRPLGAGGPGAFPSRGGGPGGPSRSGGPSPGPGEHGDAWPGDRRAGGFAAAEETPTPQRLPGEAGVQGVARANHTGPWLQHVPGQWPRERDGEHRSRFVVDAEPRLFEDPAWVAPAVIDQDPKAED